MVTPPDPASPSEPDFSHRYRQPQKQEKWLVKIINAPGAWIDRSAPGSWERVGKVAAVGLGAIAIGALASYLYVKSSGLANGRFSFSSLPILVIVLGVGAVGAGLIIRECLKGFSAQIQAATIKFLNHLAHLVLLGLIVTFLMYQFRDGFLKGMDLSGVMVITGALYGIVFLANYLDKQLAAPPDLHPKARKAYIV